MKLRIWSANTFIATGGIFLWLFCGSESYGANSLTGLVASTEEGRMEGVLVSAKKEGSTITVTVVSNNEGRYAFPSDRLPPGNYRLKIRAVGYDLDDPGVVKLEANKPVQLDLKLRKTKDLASQLMNAEWFMSIPGFQENFMDNPMARGENYRRYRSCVSCHPFAVPMMSKYDADGFMTILSRMRNYHGDSAIFQPGEVKLGVRVPESEVRPSTPNDAKLSKYLSSINLSSSPDGRWKFEFKPLPRPTGRATKVIITEYDLPRRQWMAHDTLVDREGMIWSVDCSADSYMLGRLNPRTGEVKEWRLPEHKTGMPGGSGGITLDPEGNPWVGLSNAGGGIAKFDKKTETFTPFSTPRQTGSKFRVAPDGAPWVKGGDGAAYRVDPKTGQVTTYAYPEMRFRTFYDNAVDSRGFFYGFNLFDDLIGELNPKTKQWVLYPAPTPNIGIRRGDADQQDRLWFAEYFAGKIGMFDTKTKEFKEWSLPPAPWAGPYHAKADNRGEAWAGGEFTDYVYRLNPASGEVTAYLLPNLEVNIQYVEIDNSTTPVTVWVGEQHKAKIAKVEPLD